MNRPRPSADGTRIIHALASAKAVCLAASRRQDKLAQSLAADALTAIADAREAVDDMERALGRPPAGQRARFLSYLPERPADEPHDKGCQITRMGPTHCCTCESNMERRRQQVKNAALAGDMEFRDTLGSQEAYNFDRHRDAL